ncbi:hypothetical protein ACEN2T_17260 [Pseudomonas sp. W22_MBD1_FP4]|uniref:hypothetical protein n=1 Tax=Pseudomonas sp. W22_MBD1_FP4 TaxID=3240272 RepID=UPI003F98598E
MNPTRITPLLKQWQSLYEDQAKLLKDPEGHQRRLIELANMLRAQDMIDESELAELLEQADAAYAWGIEEGGQA